MRRRRLPLGIEATRTVRNLALDFASGKRVTTAVPESWRRLRVPQCRKANHYVLAVTGLNETQLEQSRSQMASCLAKRMHGKSASTALKMAGNELGRMDAAGHHCKVRQDDAAQKRAARDRRERPVRCSCCDPQAHAVDDPRP